MTTSIGGRNPLRATAFPSMLDAARQQTELLIWVAQSVEEHAQRLGVLDKHQDQLDKMSLKLSMMANRSNDASTKAPSWKASGDQNALDQPRSSTFAVDGESNAGAGQQSAATQGATITNADAANPKALEANLQALSDDVDGRLENLGQFLSEELSAFKGNRLADEVRPLVDAALRAQVAGFIEEITTRVQAQVAENLKGQLLPRSPSPPAPAAPAALEISMPPAEVPATLKQPRLRQHDSVPDFDEILDEAPRGATAGGLDETRLVRIEEREGLTRESIARLEKKMLDKLKALETDFSSKLNMSSQKIDQHFAPLDEEVKRMRLQIPSLRMEIDETRHMLAVVAEDHDKLKMSMEEARPADDGNQVTERRTTGTVLPRASLIVPQGRQSLIPVVPPQQGRGSVSLSSSFLSYPPRPRDDELMAQLEPMKQQLAKVQGLEKLVKSLLDRLQSLDAESKTSQKKAELRLDLISAQQQAFQDEEIRHRKSWNLGNQVDVIQSLIAEQMKYVRHEVASRQKTNPGEANVLVPKAAMPQGDTDESLRRIKDVEDKVKRLQDAIQQCTLKITGLKSAHKANDSQVQTVSQMVRRLADEVESTMDQCTRHESRLDYVSMNMAAGNVLTAERTPSLRTEHQSSGRASLAPPVERTEKSNSIRSSISLGDSRRSMVRRLSRQVEVQDEEEEEDLTGHHHYHDQDATTGRLALLGKKVVGIDASMSDSFKKVGEDLMNLDLKLGVLILFLPKRLRRIIEKQLGIKSDETASPDLMPHASKRLDFNMNAETNTYSADELEVPWQISGEVEERWHWCFRPRDEACRDLMRYLQSLEMERHEFESKLRAEFQQLSEAFEACKVSQASTFLSPAGAQSPRFSSSSPVKSFAFDAMSIGGENESQHRGQDSVLNTSSFDRIAQEIRELKRAQEMDHHKRADKDDLEVLKMRIVKLEQLDTTMSAAVTRVEHLEAQRKQQADKQSAFFDQLAKMELDCIRKADFNKLRGDLAEARKDVAHMQSESKDLSVSFSGANGKLVGSLNEVKSKLELAVSKLHKEKASSNEFSLLLEKVKKLEYYTKDSRQLLSQGVGDQEVSVVVKRIILNMEDKIMLLENRVNAIVEGGKFVARPDHEIPRPASPEEATEMMQNLGAELASMSQAVLQLKQDIGVSKADIDLVVQQGWEQVELAQKLQVEVDEGTVLTWTRVQVMVAAAARALVAGSKWITKETFDLRIGELRKEYLNSARHQQAQVESVASALKVQLQPTQLQWMPSQAMAVMVAQPKLQQAMQTTLPKMNVRLNATQDTFLKTPRQDGKLSARRPNTVIAADRPLVVTNEMQKGIT